MDKAEVHHPQDVFLEMITDVEERWHRGKDLPIPSFPTIDKLLWGLPKKELVIVGGRPSQGKSVILLQMAWDLVLQGKNVFFFSLEMSIAKCMERILAMQDIDNTLITTGRLSTMYEITSIKKSLNYMTEKVKNMSNFKMVEGGFTFDQVLDTMADFDEDVDAVFVDYVQMVKNYDNAKRSIEEYIKEMRALAKAKNMNVTVGSQINRGTYDGKKVRNPEMWELKGSGALEEHSDVIMLVHWPWKYDKKKDKNEYHIGLDKNRNGRTGKIKMYFEPMYCKVEERDEDEPDKSKDTTARRVDING